MKQEKADRRGYLLLIAVNLICIALIAAFFVNYSSEYRAKLYRQNISSIGDLNRSSGTVAQAVFAFQSQKISDIARYVEAEDMTRTGKSCASSCAIPILTARTRRFSSSSPTSRGPTGRSRSSCSGCRRPCAAPRSPTRRKRTSSRG